MDEAGELYMKIRLLALIIFSMFLVSFVSAEVQTLHSEPQGDCITIPQSHPNATSINITKIRYPNATESYETIEMNTSNNINYYYEFCDTSQLGYYIVTTCGDGDGVRTCMDFDFEITPGGNSGTSNIVFAVFIITLLYGLNLFGFFGKNIPMTILTGMALIFLGIYMVNEGVIIYRDNLTNYLAYLTMGWGFISAAWAGLEQLDVL